MNAMKGWGQMPGMGATMPRPQAPQMPQAAPMPSRNPNAPGLGFFGTPGGNHIGQQTLGQTLGLGDQRRQMQQQQRPPSFLSQFFPQNMGGADWGKMLRDMLQPGPQMGAQPPAMMPQQQAQPFDFRNKIMGLFGGQQ